MQQIIIGREYPPLIIEAIKNAKVSIKILMYSWRWYSQDVGARIQKLNNEIVQAVNRGVDVDVVLNSASIINILKQNRIKAKVTNSSKTMHIKMVIIDNKNVFVGSHNFSMNGFEINHEMSVLSDDQESINKCNKFFDQICLS